MAPMLLAGRQGLHSVSIHRSCRITLELRIQDGRIIPVTVGDQDAVYGRRPGCGRAGAAPCLVGQLSTAGFWVRSTKAAITW